MIDPGSPVLAVTRTADTDGAPVETNDVGVLILWRRCYDQHGRILDLAHRAVVGERHELIYRYDSTT